MHSFNPSNIQRPVVNTFFENVSLYNRTFWSSSVWNISFQFSKIPTMKKYAHYVILYYMKKNTIDGCIKRFNYLSIGYIHWYCTGPPKIASRGKWTARWIITSKNAGGKNLSSLHSIRTIRSSSFSNSLRFRVLEQATRLLQHNNPPQNKFPTSQIYIEFYKFLTRIYLLCSN